MDYTSDDDTAIQQAKLTEIRVVEFKANFENFVVPIHSSKQKLSYVIKLNCLEGSTLTHVSYFTDLDDIWKRLEYRYGNETEMVNAVIKGIQTFAFKGCDVNTAMVKLVD